MSCDEHSHTHAWGLDIPAEVVCVAGPGVASLGQTLLSEFSSFLVGNELRAPRHDSAYMLNPTSLLEDSGGGRLRGC